MSNLEIIATEASLNNFNYNGENLFTYGEWKQRGCQVQKGEKAFLKTKLWQRKTKKNKQTGKEESYYILVNAYLFTADQVIKLEQTQAQTAK